MIVHTLGGCSPTPLANYLKALGILRLVAEQADSEARGWWEGECFRLATILDQGAIESFFLERYMPTSIISPWNKGSGFYYDNDPGLKPIESAQASRASQLKSGITASRGVLEELIEADKEVREIKAESTDKNLTKAAKKALKESPEYKKRLATAEKAFKHLKEDLMARIRLTWRGTHREWLDAAMILGEDGLPKYPALLGTGGNDGRLDFTNNFLQRLNEIFDFSTVNGTPKAEAHGWVSGALWGSPTKECQSGKAVGQFLPGMAGGANNTNGPSGNSLLNPMDFILMMEGTILFTAHATRKLGSRGHSRAAAPFAVPGQGAGYATAAASDESARGEQWMPLWSQPVKMSELKRLLSEGRVQIGARSAKEPMDIARAVARLGTARGISAFQRYGYIERNGQSNLAVPLGRFRVPKSSHPSLTCLDDLDAWLVRLRIASRGKDVPARLSLVERRLSDALFAVIQHPDEKIRWQSVLLAMGMVEAVLRTGAGCKAGPIPRLRPEWVQAADDGSAEFRLALACALQSSGFLKEGHSYDSVRRHWLPLSKNGFATIGSGGQIRIQTNPGVVMEGRSGSEDAIRLVQRRLIEAAQTGERKPALVAAKKSAAWSADIASLLAGEVDIQRTMNMATALMAIDSWHWASNPRPPAFPAETGAYPDDGWLAIRLALLPWPLPDGRVINADPVIVRRLASGDLSAAVRTACQRLKANGIKSAIRFATAGPNTASLWCAALAFPINRKTAVKFLHRIDTNSLKENTP